MKSADEIALKSMQVINLSKSFRITGQFLLSKRFIKVALALMPAAEFPPGSDYFKSPFRAHLPEFSQVCNSGFFCIIHLPRTRLAFKAAT